MCVYVYEHIYIYIYVHIVMIIRNIIIRRMKIQSIYSKSINKKEQKRKK